MRNPDFDRRAALTVILSGALLALVAVDAEGGESASRLNEEDDAARVLLYVADVRRAKGAQPGSRCATCALYAGDRKAAYGPCPIFDNKLVSTKGWCKAWEKMS